MFCNNSFNTVQHSYTFGLMFVTAYLSHWATFRFPSTNCRLFAVVFQYLSIQLKRWWCCNSGYLGRCIPDGQIACASGWIHAMSLLSRTFLHSSSTLHDIQWHNKGAAHRVGKHLQSHLSTSIIWDGKLITTPWTLVTCHLFSHVFIHFLVMSLILGYSSC